LNHLRKILSECQRMAKVPNGVEILPKSLTHIAILSWLRSEIRPECFEVLLCLSFIQSVAIRPAFCIRITSIRRPPIQSYGGI